MKKFFGGLFVGGLILVGILLSIPWYWFVIVGLVWFILWAMWNLSTGWMM
jgi:hypothetical protein